jgi:hypothetical protein
LTFPSPSVKKEACKYDLISFSVVLREPRARVCSTGSVLFQDRTADPLVRGVSAMKASLSAFRSTIHDLLSTIVARPWRHAMALRSPSVALTSDRCRSVFSVLCRSSSFLPSILHLRSSIPSRRALLAVTVALALTANVASTLSAFPHTLSYFNELVGGPLNGPLHLLDANVDWGQDLLYLKDWYDEHPESKPLIAIWFGFISLDIARIEYGSLPAVAVRPNDHLVAQLRRDNVAADRWCAISVNELQGYNHFGERGDSYDSLRRLSPIAHLGYSIRLFHISDDELLP